MPKLDIGFAWRDAMAMMRANGEVLALITGLFLLLPSLLWSLLMPDPPQQLAGMTKQEHVAAVLAWVGAGAPYIILASVLAMFGSLVIWHLLLARAATVGDALRGALKQFLPFFAAMLLFALAFAIGWTLFILPGLFVYARLCLIGPHMAASGTMNPVDGLRGSWRATKGNAFWTLVLLLIITVVGFVAVMLVGGIVGGLLTAVLGQAGAAIPNKVLNGILGALLSLVLSVVGAAIYRQIGDRGERAAG